ncbi:MAG: DM13 domain-containing protein [Ferruginibacter sp.]
MKKLLIGVTCLLVAFTSCKKDASPANALNEMADASAIPAQTGTFMNGPYGNVSGDVRIYLDNGNINLSLENFSTSNGPDLHVYLSKEKQPINFVDLGRIKSTGGNQVYMINRNISITGYKYALIHCQQYNHLFGSAELK